MNQTIARHNESEGAGKYGAGGELPFDLQELVRRCMGRIELAERLLASFESRFPADLEKVEACLAEGDTAKLARLVHQLKGAAANISAPELHVVMSRMEEAVRAERRDEAAERLAEARQAWDRFVGFQRGARPGAGGSN
jgi:HPt (histidine-containing phosphotransfer) domain-containing protein